MRDEFRAQHLRIGDVVPRERAQSLVDEHTLGVTVALWLDPTGPYMRPHAVAPVVKPAAASAPLALPAKRGEVSRAAGHSHPGQKRGGK